MLKRRNIVTILILISLPAYLVLTNPAELPLLGVLVPIALFFGASYSISEAVILRLRPDIIKAKARILSLVIALFPSLIIVLQSLKQLNLKDVLIITGVWLIFAWYLQKIDYI